jgi:hypothetical protein
MLNTDKDAPLVHSLGHGENAEMVLNTDQHMDSSCDYDYNTVNTGEKIPIKYTVKMCDQLIAGLKQCPCITEHKNMAKDRLLRQKPMSMKQNPVLGPSPDVQIQPDVYNDGSTDAPSSPRSSNSQM